MNVNVRMAKEQDIIRIADLLMQVCLVHHKGRPDLFKHGTRKYTDEQLSELIHNETTPILVAADDTAQVMGYAFCRLIQHAESPIFTDVKTLYIDDLCVDENRRGQHIGKTLYEAVLEFARAHGCYNVTLNVWSCNPGAQKFYESCGLKPQKVGMEVILSDTPIQSHRSAEIGDTVC